MLLRGAMAEPLSTEAYESGGALLDANATAVPAKGATSVNLIVATEKAKTAKVKALEPRWRTGHGAGSKRCCKRVQQSASASPSRCCGSCRQWVCHVTCHALRTVTGLID